MGTPLAPCRNLIGLNEDRGDPNGKLTAGWSKPIAQLNETAVSNLLEEQGAPATLLSTVIPARGGR
jgi:hypothetical protein